MAVKLRGRLLLGSVLLVLVPLALFAVLIRQQTANRLRDQYTRRIETLADGIDRQVRSDARLLRDRLRALRARMADDHRLRIALAQDASEIPEVLLDYAPEAMTLLALDFLRVQDETGRILSSGHFRNEYGRVDAVLPARLSLASDEPVLVPARRPTGPFLTFAVLDSLRVGSRGFRLIGGLEIGAEKLASLAPDRELVVLLIHPGGLLAPEDRPVPPFLREIDSSALSPDLTAREDHLVRMIRLTAVPSRPEEPAPFDRAHLVIVHSLEPMRSIVRGLDLSLAVAWFLVAAGTLAVASRVSTRISRPLEDLAARTAAIDVDRLDVEFAADRRDEVGTLSRFLGEMTRRLRSSVVRLRDAERRATLGELARQVNHDLRNGITPLRNVVRHLASVADASPEEFSRVYGERRGTLDAGLDYLEELASHYRRLSSHPARRPCAAEVVVREVIAGRTLSDGGPVEVVTAPGLPEVAVDPVGLRRIVENLVANACESLESGRGRVRVILERAVLDGEDAVRLVVADDGAGMSSDVRERIFDPFYTTKESGTGLGLAIVRRLVSDFEGTVEVESEPGRGAMFTVTIPASVRRSSETPSGEPASVPADPPATERTPPEEEG
jgi:signal transduction histidine kinase